MNDPIETAAEQMLREHRSPASPPVTVETVGIDAMRSSPIAHTAVRFGMRQDELIRLLLAENKRLTGELTKALNTSSSPMLKSGL